MPVIAMTHEIGTNGRQIAIKVAASLQLLYAESQFIEDRVAERLHGNMIQSCCNPGWQSVPGIPAATNQRKLARMAEDEIRELTAYGNVVLRGWGAATMLRDTPSVVRIRICAPQEFRARNLACRYPDWSASDIEREIEAMDACLATNLQPVLGKDWRSDQTYHLVIDTQELGVLRAAGLIEEVVRSRSRRSDATFDTHSPRVRSTQ